MSKPMLIINGTKMDETHALCLTKLSMAGKRKNASCHLEENVEEVHSPTRITNGKTTKAFLVNYIELSLWVEQNIGRREVKGAPLRDDCKLIVGASALILLLPVCCALLDSRRNLQSHISNHETDHG